AKSTGSTVTYYNTVLPIRLRNTSLAKDTMVYIFDDASLNGTNIYYNTSFPVTSIEVDPYSEAYTYSPVVNAPNIVVAQQMIAFTGTKNDPGVDLEWQPALSGDFTNYEIERSGDGSHFESIASIQGTESKTFYTYGDQKALPGNNFYRLKMIDRSGSKAYSNTIMVQFSQKAKIKIWPNPANDRIVISSQGAGINNQSIRLINTAGQSFSPSVVNNSGNSIEIKVGSLQSGVYWLELRQKDGSKIVERIMVRH
ncbi:MAG: T9SS type A sorting domain-containing protein, partial [Chitinophagaceae bacterium]